MDVGWAAPIGCIKKLIAQRIQMSCGEEFVYRNKNGKCGIRKAVLVEFRRLTQGQLVWVVSERAWRRK